MATSLDQLMKYTVTVADTGEIEAMKQYKPADATTNPSLVLKALTQLKSNSEDEKSSAEYDKVISLAVEYAKSKAQNLDEQLSWALDRIAVEFGKRILEIIPGYVSTELDARLSFDVNASVDRAKRVILIYEECGVKNAKERVLIKIATTWEGCLACKQLQSEGIRTNMTLLFSIWQAAAAAQIGNAFLISPFVGRITDWYKKDLSVDGFKAADDPGVKSVNEIFNYYKKFNIKTIVMGASFRNKEQIMELCGCDRLTIAPQLLKELKDCNEKVEKKLDGSKSNVESEYEKLLNVTENNYRYGLCQDAMATEKLAEGIRRFAADIVKLENILREKLQA